MYPTARRSHTIAQQLDEEMMVFDSTSDQFHLLNPLAAFVFRHADGETAPGDLLRLARERFGTQLRLADVEVALDELQNADLIEPSEGRSAPRSTVSRRDAARRMAALALSVPLVTSILAPEPAMAASVRIRGNNGVGNGVDPCPSENSNCGNDGVGQTPGNPGGSTTAPGHGNP